MIVRHMMSISSKYGLFGCKGTRGLKIGNMQKIAYTALVDAIPATWRVAAVVGQGVPALAVPLPSTAVIVHTHMLDRLGWAHPTVAARTIGLSALTVKTATQLQLQAVLDAREAKQMASLSEACNGLVVAQHAQPKELRRLLKVLWSIPWDIQRKECFWRFTVDGLPTAAHMHMLGKPCAVSDHLAPDRGHHYWECPVAQAVVQELHRVLASLLKR